MSQGHAGCGWVIPILVIGCAAPQPLPLATQSGIGDTTIVQRGPRDLEFALTLSPVPRYVGDTTWVSVSVRNFGSSPTQVRITPCYLTLTGPPIQPWPPDVDVCASATGEELLPPRGSWTFNQGFKMAGPSGRYRLTVKVADSPRVLLGTDLDLAGVR